MIFGKCEAVGVKTGTFTFTLSCRVGKTHDHRFLDRDVGSEERRSGVSKTIGCKSCKMPNTARGGEPSKRWRAWLHVLNCTYPREWVYTYTRTSYARTGSQWISLMQILDGHVV